MSRITDCLKTYYVEVVLSLVLVLGLAGSVTKLSQVTVDTAFVGLLLVVVGAVMAIRAMSAS
jgi:hypothetical protein